MTPARWLWGVSALLFWVVIQYNLPNLGNNLLPRNFFAWAVLVLATAGLLVHAVRQDTFRWSNWCYFWFLPAAAVLLHSVIFPPALPHYSLLAAGALGGFALWLVALMQVQLDDQAWYRISLTVFVGGWVLVMLALPTANYLNRPEWLSGLPLAFRLPEGGFQQRNVFASFLSAAAIWCWAMRLRSGPKALWDDLLFSLALFVMAWCVYLSGSRTGAVAISAAALVLALYAVWRGWRHWGLWLPTLAVGMALVVTIISPIEDINARMADLADGSSTSTRLSMWKVSYALGLQQPWFGHGLGSFMQAFHPAFVQAVREGQDLAYVNFLNHPHNETALWWVEAGVYGLALVILPWVVSLFFLVLWRNPAAVLFMVSLGPMLLHTQTEFPLHTSGVHWFLAGLIIASTVRPNLLPARPSQLKPIWPGVIALFALPVMAGLVQTGWMAHKNWKDSQRLSFQQFEQVEARSQHPVMNHPILGSEARDFWTLTLARLAGSESTLDWLAQIVPFLEDMQTRWQGPVVWEALANSYALLGEDEKLAAQLAWVEALQPSEGARLRQVFQPSPDASPGL